jgi:hypothetical protein
LIDVELGFSSAQFVDCETHQYAVTRRVEASPVAHDRGGAQEPHEPELRETTQGKAGLRTDIVEPVVGDDVMDVPLAGASYERAAESMTCRSMPFRALMSRVVSVGLSLTAARMARNSGRGGAKRAIEMFSS